MYLLLICIVSLFNKIIDLNLLSLVLLALIRVLWNKTSNLLKKFTEGISQTDKLDQGVGSLKKGLEHPYTQETIYLP